MTIIPSVLCVLADPTAANGFRTFFIGCLGTMDLAIVMKLPGERESRSARMGLLLRILSRSET